jgi:protoporphyrinogen oxidase
MSNSGVQSQRVVDVAVLGGGPAGLAAAWYAARRGRSVVVLDRAPRVGGLAASITVDGQRVDLGSHRLHPSIRPDLLADLAGLLGDELQRRPRNGRIRLDGRWVAFPLRPTDFLRNARPAFTARIAADVAASPWRRRRVAAGDFSAAVRRSLGPAIAAAFYEPYARKLWGIEPGELSAALFRRRVGAGTLAGIAGRALRPGGRPSFWYPAGGFGRISEAIAAAITSAGGSIELGTTLRRITPSGDHVAVEGDDGPAVHARTVVSTIGAADLAALAGAPDTVADAASTLTHRGVVLVYLGVPRPRYTTFDAHYFPQPAVRISRLSEPKRYRDSAADPVDRTVLCAELPATAGDELWRMTEDQLADLVAADLSVAGLPDPRPTVVHVERLPRVYPVYRLGFEAAQRVVEDWVDELTGVVAVGRQPLFAHDNTHHALLMGNAVAQCLDDDGRLDAERWRDARAEFAGHVVED